jgi:hypothetical protein
MNTLTYHSVLLLLLSLFITAVGLAIPDQLADQLTSASPPVKEPTALSNGTLAYLAAPPEEVWPWSGEGPWTSGGVGLYPEHWLSLLGRSDRELVRDGGHSPVRKAEAGEHYRAQKAEDGGVARHQNWPLGLWIFGTAVVLVVAVGHAVLCWTLSWHRDEALVSSGEHPRARKAEVGSPKVTKLASYHSWMPRPGLPGSSVPGSACSLASSGLLSTGMKSESDASLLKGARMATTLCPQLVVPKNCTLQCALPRTVCHRRQNLIVSIKSLAVPVETALFQARLAEGDSAEFSGAGIHLEMLGGEEQFAFLSTEDVWASQGARQPEMEITKVSGEKYATMKKTDNATYIMARGMDTLMVFSGRFSKHELQVCCAAGQMLARVIPSSTKTMYEVLVYTNADAGLIILGLLAIDKVEVAPT